jgi:hypothetical protein
MNPAVGTQFKDFLEQHGFSPVKAELWTEFIESVLSVLREAAAELRRPTNWTHFKEKRGALGAPRKRKRRKVVERIPIEDAITSELAHFIRHIRRSLPLGHFLRVNEVEFHVEDMVPSKARAGRHSRKVDFFVYAASGPYEPEIAIEAKPLVSEADIGSRYLAEDGIGCFFAPDSPYTHRELGGMLAYSISSEGRSWRTEVCAAVKTYVPAIIQATEVILAGESNPVICSRHERSALDLSPIAILHLEMIFEPDVQSADPGS